MYIYLRTSIDLIYINLEKISTMTETEHPNYEINTLIHLDNDELIYVKETVEEVLEKIQIEKACHSREYLPPWSDKRKQIPSNGETIKGR